MAAELRAMDEDSFVSYDCGWWLWVFKGDERVVEVTYSFFKLLPLCSISAWRRDVTDMYWQHVTRSRIQSKCRDIWGVGPRFWESVVWADMSLTCRRHFLLSWWCTWNSWSNFWWFDFGICRGRTTRQWSQNWYALEGGMKKSLESSTANNKVGEHDGRNAYE
jgi:hypothetical protein